MRSVPGTQRPRDKAGMLRPPFATAVLPLPPSLQPPPIEHRRCCHIHDGVHLQFSAQITLEAHSNREQIFIQRFPSTPRREISWTRDLFPLESSSLCLQFLSTDNFPSRKGEEGENYLFLYPLVTKLRDSLTFQLVRTKTFPDFNLQRSPRLARIFRR